jgi:hypothetical protein
MWNKWVRQIHRWLSIAFTVTVIANFIPWHTGWDASALGNRRRTTGHGLRNSVKYDTAFLFPIGQFSIVWT